MKIEINNKEKMNQVDLVMGDNKNVIGMNFPVFGIKLDFVNKKATSDLEETPRISAMLTMIYNMASIGGVDVTSAKFMEIIETTFLNFSDADADEETNWFDDTSVVYVTDSGDEYTPKQILDIAKGNSEIAGMILSLCSWQSPETVLEELLEDEEIEPTKLDGYKVI